MTKLTLLESLLREVTAIVQVPNIKLSTVVGLPNQKSNSVARQLNVLHSSRRDFVHMY